MSKVLVTGGAGFIGSHMSLVLLEAGFQVVVLDNFSNSSIESLVRVKRLTNKSLDVIEGDVRNEALLNEIFSKHRLEAVFHFAGLKAVGESVAKPLDYYSTNVEGTIRLCSAMSQAAVYKLVFSSSCTVYGNPQQVPIPEEERTNQPTNPYGRSKLMAERVLTDLATSKPKWKIASLRYFNPIGAHQSGLIGEDPTGTPNNLVPYITQVAIGRIEKLRVFGNDYATTDGTGVRDYIHVMDLAEGHLAALRALETRDGLNIWNLGTGVGYSVLEVLKVFETVTSRIVPYSFESRRSGDIDSIFADPSKALRELDWRAKRDLIAMVRDAWCWQSKNPNGYAVSDEAAALLPGKIKV